MLQLALQTFRFILQTLLYGWVTALRDLWRIICKLLRRWWDRQCLGEKATPQHCVPINNPAFVRPDPLIYDQYYLTSLGLAVTWDNPDIQLYLNGVPVSSSQLQPGTTYEVVAQVWNNSTEAPVVNMPVAFSFLEFGVGTVSVPIGSTRIDLGVKGGPNCPALARMLWTTPTTLGHYCLQVLLQPVDDTNTQNNLGQENTDVGTAHSAAVFKFALRNNTALPRGYEFAVDAYAPGPPPPCNGSGNPEEDRRARLARHRRGSQPLPAGWTVKVDPETPSLAPSESTLVTVTATPPVGFTGNQTINVNAFRAARLAGGVSLTVTAV
jgi:hypothetical protein